MVKLNFDTVTSYGATAALVRADGDGKKLQEICPQGLRI
jgi:hypothetical protein